MARDLLPWRKKKQTSLTRAERRDDNPFLALHREINELFDEFFGEMNNRFAWLPSGGLRGDAWALNVDVSENDKELVVTADVPGMDEKDIEVELSDGLLSIKGERKEERDEKKDAYHLTERSYGVFQRTIPLPGELLEDQAKAKFKKGVLTVSIPKSPDAKRNTRRQIAVTTE